MPSDILGAEVIEEDTRWPEVAGDGVFVPADRDGRAGLEGTMLGPSIFSGRVAGGWAAHAAGHGAGFVGKPNRG